jgi:hypothetical protein
MSEMKAVIKKDKEVKLEDMVTMEDDSESTKSVQLLSVIWERVILDEAHQVPMLQKHFSFIAKIGLYLSLENLINLSPEA